MNRKHATSFVFAMSVMLNAGIAFAQTVPPYVSSSVSDPARPAADTKIDGDRKPAEVIAFAGVKPGSKILELVGASGYYTRILSRVVGPKGRIYSTVPTAVVKVMPKFGDALTALASNSAYSNVTVISQSDSSIAKTELVDFVWLANNYHDFHNPGPFGADLNFINRTAFAALKSGGSYIIIDHTGATGTGLTQTNTLHRIDPAAVKDEVTRAGFVFVSAGDVLHRPSDDLSTHSTFKDDQFVFRFRKP